MNIITPSGIPSLTVGGRVFTDLANLIVLRGYATTGALNSSMAKKGTTAGYQVTSGKSLRIESIEVFSASATTNVNLAYGDNDVGFASAAAPTNLVYNFSNQNAANNPSASVANTATFYNVGWNIPSLKFPSIVISASTLVTVSAYGYEV